MRRSLYMGDDNRTIESTNKIHFYSLQIGFDRFAAFVKSHSMEAALFRYAGIGNLLHG